MPTVTKPANRLLALLPSAEYRRLAPKLERVDLNFKEKIYSPGDIISDVYFPESGIISLLAADGKSTLEVGLIGNEGMLGLPIFMGVTKSGNQAVVQGTGAALRITAQDIKAVWESGSSSALARVINRYTHSLITQISQSAVCYCFHQIELRLARWLLMTADRMMANEFLTTQEFLSNMLGVRREAVTLAVRKLQHQNLISYSRGLIKILDRKALEIASCSCYKVIRDDEKSFPTMPAGIT